MLNNLTSCGGTVEYRKKTFKEKLSYLFNETDLIALRFTVAIASLTWFAMLLWPGNTFDRPMFSIVEGAMSEIAWAMLFCIHGISVLFSLFSCSKQRILIFLDGILGSFLWSGMSIGMLSTMFFHSIDSYMSMPAASGPSIIIALATWWILIRFPSYTK